MENETLSNMSEQTWYESETPAVPSNLTIAELEDLCSRIAEQRRVCDEISARHKEENKKLDLMENGILAALEQLGKDNYRSNVGTFSITHRTSVKVPQGDDKMSFLDYLKERGIHDSMVTVNSQTLNGWYRQEFEQARSEGRLMEFSIPGIGEPVINKLISFRKAN